MTYRFALAVLAALLATVPSVRGESTLRKPYLSFLGLTEVRPLIRGWCPDDYCPKQLPPVPCVNNSGWLMDYCPKPLPAAPCPTPPGCVNDYDPKWCPIYLGVGAGPSYRCGP
jgi:hypothetical protein